MFVSANTKRLNLNKIRYIIRDRVVPVVIRIKIAYVRCVERAENHHIVHIVYSEFVAHMILPIQFNQSDLVHRTQLRVLSMCALIVV